ncbi:unnamed protein product [Rotaria sp. Silwood1]|nr:unnamed protein product [Rotaria sp. Silwood1]
MRLVGDKDHEHIWQSRLETLGPFAVILASYVSPYQGRSGLVSTTVYRGAQLSDDIIADYRCVAESDDKRRSFQAFTSCSRSQELAEQFGNVLFVLNVVDEKECLAHSLDVSPWSAYPDEQEVLIPPGRSVKIERVNFDSRKNKHFIYLTLLGRDEQ